MKILIIGSEGFIGSHVVDYFLNENWEVHGIDLKEIPHREYNYKKILPQTINYESIFAFVKPDVCLFASGSASVNFSIQDPLSDLEANFLQVSRVLNMIKIYSPACKFINISSAAVYGNPDSLPIKEDFNVKPLSPYGWHKYYSELACKEYSSLYSIKTCSLRPFSVYGPGQNKLLFWDIYKKVLKDKEKIELFGSGHETRDFIYISDLINAINLVIKNAPMQGEFYNVASGEESKIAVVAELLLHELNYKGKLVFNNMKKAGDPNNWVADITNLKRIGFSPLVNINRGLNLYALWLKENGF
jgi:UDP-glucose 4-epimerase